MVAYAYELGIWEVRQNVEFKASLGYIVRPVSKKKRIPVEWDTESF
jgi:hypothetical protein